MRARDNKGRGSARAILAAGVGGARALVLGSLSRAAPRALRLGALAGAARRRGLGGRGLALGLALGPLLLLLLSVLPFALSTARQSLACLRSS